MSASDDLLAELAAEIARQDTIHPQGWAADRDGIRLGIATIEDEMIESRDAWRAERKVEGWPGTEAELMQTAAVALRLLRSIRAAREGETDQAAISAQWAAELSADDQPTAAPDYDLQEVADTYVRELVADYASPVRGGGPGWDNDGPCIDLYVDLNRAATYQPPAAPHDLPVNLVAIDGELEASPEVMVEVEPAQEVDVLRARLRDYAVNSVRRHAMPFVGADDIDFAFDGTRYVGMLYTTGPDNVNGYDREGYMICQLPTADEAAQALIEYDKQLCSMEPEERKKREFDNRAAEGRNRRRSVIREVLDMHEISEEIVTGICEPNETRPSFGVIDAQHIDRVRELLEGQQPPAQ